MVVVVVPSKVRAGYLFPSPQGEGFIVPTFATEYSEWNIFYSPNGANYPDIAGPFGTKQSASSAGFTPPADSSPSNPQAYWNVNNPTITQTNTAANAFIIGQGVSGNIYSPTGPTSFVVNDTVSQALGTVVFQFQTEGTLVDFSSIKLVLQYGERSAGVERQANTFVNTPAAARALVAPEIASLFSGISPDLESLPIRSFSMPKDPA